MATKDFGKALHMKGQILYVVVCVYQNRSRYQKESPVNQMLETLQRELKEELETYQEIQIAFVYGTPELHVRIFQKLERDTPIFYKEPEKVGNAAHIWMMGMALLEQTQGAEEEQAKVDRRLYFITDAKILRKYAQLMVFGEAEQIGIHPRFHKVKFTPFLWRSSDAKGDLLEEYIKKQSKCRVRTFE